jgi:glucokinase
VCSGVCLLKATDVIHLNRTAVDNDGVKVVMGPGTGLGVGILTKSKFANCHEVYPSEGGHTDFAVRDEQDFRLRQFAIDYIENSKNVENKRGEGKIDRVSIERMCAGPAVPLIYAFLKKEHPEVASPLGEKIAFDDMTSADIIAAGMAKKDADPLCEMVIAKFSEIFAVEVGNMALKCIPYGGIYLVGGVTSGIAEYLELDRSFIHTMYMKGRHTAIVRRIPVFLVRSEVELGIMGAEECAFRDLGCYSV